MQRLTLDIPVAGYAVGDVFEAYSNADPHGIAGPSIDTDRPIDAARPLRPLGAPDAGHVSFTTRPLYHGWYRFSLVTRDALGNPSEAGDPFAVPVTSGPALPARFRQSGVASGRPVFLFDPPVQFTEAL